MLGETVVTLIEALEKERRCCDRLIEVSKDEQKSLVDNNLEMLNKRINEMQTAVKDLHALQRHRREMLEQLAASLDIRPENVSLRSVLEKLEGSAAGQLRAKMKTLIKTGETLYRINQQTIYLINFSLDLVERQISAWTDVLTEKEGYDEDGRSKAGRSEAKIVEEKV